MLFRLRAALLVVLLTAVVIPWCAVVLAHWVTPQPRRYQVAAMWTRFAMRAAQAAHAPVDRTQAPEQRGDVAQTHAVGKQNAGDGQQVVGIETAQQR